MAKYKEHRLKGARVEHFILEYETEEEKDPLLLIGDVGADCLYADGIATALGHMFHFFCYDRAGTGQTLGNAEAYTPDLLLEDLAEVVTYVLSLCQASKIVLAASGLGTALAVRFIHFHPNLVSYYCGISQMTCPEDYEKARCMAMELVFNMKNQMKNVLFMSRVHELTGGSYHLDMLPVKERKRLQLMQHGMGMHGYRREEHLMRVAGRSCYWKGKKSRQLVREALKQTGTFMALEYKFQMENFSGFASCPGLIIAGRHDFVNPYTLVREYWEHIWGADSSMELELVQEGDGDFMYRDPIACWSLLWKHYTEWKKGENYGK